MKKGMSKIKFNFQAKTAEEKQVSKSLDAFWQEMRVPEKPELTYTVQLDHDNAVTATFALEKDAENIRVAANSAQHLFAGAMYACRQLVLGQPLDTDYHEEIKERIVMIDIGRKYFSLADLKKAVRSLALFQFTHLQLHFSENEGFRIESKEHPEIVSEHFLTQAEITELIAYANTYFIEIIPDIDSPGHLKQVLKTHPEWQLVNDELDALPTALDISKPAAVTFIKSIYREYAKLFSESTYFHIGADEFIDFEVMEKYPRLTHFAQRKWGETATGFDAFTDYVNQIIAEVKKLGFTPRVWNDGFYRVNRHHLFDLSTDCEISYWTKWHKNMAPVTTFFKKGYNVINHNDNYLYYVLGEAAGYTYPTYEKIAEEFTLTTFSGKQLITATHKKQVPAVALSIWSDVPDAQTAPVVLDNIFWLEAALAEKVYATPALGKATYHTLFDMWK